MFADENKEEKAEKNEVQETSEQSVNADSSENAKEINVEKENRTEKKPKVLRPASGRFEKHNPERKQVVRRGIRQGIRRDEYKNRPYDALPARDFNIQEILTTGNPDVINRTAEDYGKTWGDRPHWIKNRFSTFQIRPIMSKIYKIKQNAFEGENVNELKLLKPLVAYIARRYHDDDLYEFARIMRYAIDEIGDDSQKFKHFCSFFDAVLLFFRANGGK